MTSECNPHWELDHLFVWTDEGAPEAEVLIRSGLTEGTRNTHPGQGTANRRFFFDNAFIELIWVHDRMEAQSNPALHFWERWSGRKSGVCPFGFIFRPQLPDAAAPPPLTPFDTWEYHPAYLPDNLSFLVGKNADRLGEPMLFCMPFGRRPDSISIHKLGVREIKELRLCLPSSDEPSSVFRDALGAGLFSIKAGSQFAVEILTGAGNFDFRPDLPLMFV